MHIHGNSTDVQSASFSAAQGERAAVAAQRAAEVRKRLLKSSQSIESGADPDATLLVGQWLDSRHSQVLPQDEYRSAASGKDPDLG